MCSAPLWGGGSVPDSAAAAAANGAGLFHSASRRGGSGSGRCARALSPLICVYLTDVGEPHEAEERSGVGGRGSPSSVWMLAPRVTGTGGTSGLSRGGKVASRRRSLTNPGKVWSLSAGLVLTLTAHSLSPPAGLRVVRRHAGET